MDATGFGELIKHWWGEAVTVVGAVAAGVGAIVKWRGDRAKHQLEIARLKAQIARDGAEQENKLMELAERAAANMFSVLQAEVDRLRGRVEELEAQLSTAHQERAALVAELAITRGHLRQALANLDAYDRLLTEHDIPHQKPAQALFLVEAGAAPSEVHTL